MSEQPVYCIVKVYHNGEVTTLYDDLARVSVRVSGREMTSDARILIDNYQGKYSTKFSHEDDVEVLIEKGVYPPTKTIFKGFIERRRFARSFNENILELKCVDYTRLLHFRLVTESFRNKEVSAIVKELISKYAPDISTTYVETTTTTVPDIRWSYRPLVDCLKQLALLPKEGEHVFYVDADKNLHFFLSGTKHSGVSYMKDDIYEATFGDDSTKLKNVVLIRGGYTLEKDQAQETVVGSSSLHEYFYADELTPIETTMKQIELYVEKVGNPAENLKGKIVEDKDGTPTGSTLKFFERTRLAISTADWYAISIEIAVVSGKKLWIVLDKVGDAANTYKWYHDGTTDKTFAYSTDGKTWTVSTTGPNYTFRTYFGAPVLAQTRSTGMKYRREKIFMRATILSREAARLLATQELKRLAKLQHSCDLTVEFQNAAVNPGELVYIEDPELGLPGKNYEVQEIEYELLPRQGTFQQTLTVAASEKSEEIQQIMAELQRSLYEERLKTAGIDETTILELYEVLYEEAALKDVLVVKKPEVFEETVSGTDVLSAVEQLSGTFKVGEAKVGFADVG